MKYHFSLPQLPDTAIDVEKSYWSGKKSVWANGKACAQAAHSSRRAPKFIIPVPDGTEKVLGITPSPFFDDGLTVSLDGATIPIPAPLKWYEYIMGCLPVFLVFIGGAIGGLIGGIGACCNFKIVRGSLSMPLKILAALGVTLIAAALYFVFAFLFMKVVH